MERHLATAFDLTPERYSKSGDFLPTTRRRGQPTRSAVPRLPRRLARTGAVARRRHGRRDRGTLPAPAGTRTSAKVRSRHAFANQYRSNILPALITHHGEQPAVSVAASWLQRDATCYETSQTLLSDAGLPALGRALPAHLGCVETNDPDPLASASERVPVNRGYSEGLRTSRLTGVSRRISPGLPISPPTPRMFRCAGVGVPAPLAGRPLRRDRRCYRLAGPDFLLPSILATCRSA